MIVCPVCESTQVAGEVCDTCGKQLSKVKVAEAPVPVLAELELTHHANGRANVVAERLAELDTTKLEVGPDLPAMEVAGLEPTRQEAAGELPVLPMGELDTGRVEDDGPRTAAPVGPVTCRYCKNVQEQGALCDKCGMRLPRVAARPSAAALLGTQVNCQACGVKTQAGLRCQSCGVAWRPR